VVVAPVDDEEDDEEDINSCVDAVFGHVTYSKTLQTRFLVIGMRWKKGGAMVPYEEAGDGDRSSIGRIRTNEERIDAVES